MTVDYTIIEQVITSRQPLEFGGSYSATLNNMKLVRWSLMGGLLYLVQRGGDWVGLSPTANQRRPLSPGCYTQSPLLGWIASLALTADCPRCRRQVNCWPRKSVSKSGYLYPAPES